MADPDDIRGWQRLSSEITTSGKLDPDDVARLHAIGVRHVINLALDDHPEALRDEAALLEARGIGYTHIPVAFERPTVDHYLEFRVSAFFYMLHREQGMAGKEAEALMARQWNPLTSEDPRTLPWRDLLMRTAGSPRAP